MKLKELLKGTGIAFKDEWSDLEITGLSCDSRHIKKGYAFICLKGMHTDGHIYAMDAVVRGAAAVISEKPIPFSLVPNINVNDSMHALSALSANYYGHPSEDIVLFGITGTNGKTTVSYMIHNGLEADGKLSGLTGTISYKVGEKTYEASYTTPDPLSLQQYFYEMKRQGIGYCVMEVSSHALKLGRVDHICFDYGLFTNLTQDHMDFHKNKEEYYQSKKKLFYLTKKAAIINVDDEYGSRLTGDLGDTHIEKISCSMRDKRADFYGKCMKTDREGSGLRLYRQGQLLGNLSVHSPGTFFLYNALTAAAGLLTAEIPFKSVKEGFSSLKGVPGRFELVRNKKDITVIVDYAHTPDALQNVLKTARDIGKGRLITVFGCGGDRDPTKRPLMGRIAGQYSDHCIITSDNPRDENQSIIASGIEEGLYDTGCNYDVIHERRKAIERALVMYRKGDVILVAGKGHETYQIIGGSKNYFSDQETVSDLIGAMDGSNDDEANKNR